MRLAENTFRSGAAGHFVVYNYLHDIAIFSVCSWSVRVYMQCMVSLSSLITQRRQLSTLNDRCVNF